MQAPEEEVVKVDSVRALEVMPGLHLLRGACNSRLKFEVEYNLRRGTTDNCYLLQVRWLGAWQCTTAAFRLVPPDACVHCAFIRLRVRRCWSTSLLRHTASSLVSSTSSTHGSSRAVLAATTAA